MTVEVRLARPAELPAAMTVFDSAQLAVSARAVRAAIEADRVLVASEGGRVLGALVVGPSDTGAARIEAIAVRRRRRGQGIGTALVRAAADRYGPLEAEFDARVRPFWESVGFDIEPAAEPERFVGRLAGAGGER